jgi:hypothetical protein
MEETKPSNENTRPTLLTIICIFCFIIEVIRILGFIYRWIEPDNSTVQAVDTLTSPSWTYPSFFMPIVSILKLYFLNQIWNLKKIGLISYASITILLDVLDIFRMNLTIVNSLLIVLFFDIFLVILLSINLKSLR